MPHQDDRFVTASTRRQFLAASGALLLVGCSAQETESAVPTAAEPPTAVPTESPEPTSAPTAESTEVPVESTAAPTQVPAPPKEEPTPDNSPPPLVPAMFDSLAVCKTTPTAPAGPFPSKSPLNRVDIHDGYPGHPLRLGIRVVDGNCQPVPEAIVDIWHCDASGDYSEFEDGGTGKDEGAGSTFCRGAQTSNADGILEFETIYPGWYEGQPVHIHAMVRRSGELVRTVQFYFDNEYSAGIFVTGEYAQFGLPDRTKSAETIASDGSGVVLAEGITARGAGTLGLINLGI